jgi:hypothetical protein
MTPRTIEDIYAAKAARRKHLASLSIDGKVDLIERLHELGRTMIEARGSLPGGAREKSSGESFNEVVQPDSGGEPAVTGANLCQYFRTGGSGVSEHYLDAVDAAEKNDQPPNDSWT